MDHDHPMPITAVVDEPDDDLLDAGAAIWLTLLSCRDMADTDVGHMLSAAMASLEEATQLASALPPGERRPWVDELRDIDLMVEAIHVHLRDARPINE